MKKVLLTLLAIFLLFGGAAFVLQSPWGQKKAATILENALNESGARLQIGALEGAFPHEVRLQNVKLETDDFVITAEKLRVQISLIQLLKRELVFNELIGERVVLTEKTTNKPLETVAQTGEKVPYLLSVRHFRFEKVSLPNTPEIDFEGYLRVGKKSRYAFLDALIKQTNVPEESLHLTASLRRTGTLQVKADLKGFQTEEGLLSLELYMTAPFSHFAKQGTIRGRFLGHFTPDQVPHPLMQGTWAFSSHFVRDQEARLLFSKLVAKNQNVEIKGSGRLTSEQKLDTAKLEIATDKLLPGNLHASIQMRRINDTLAIQGAYQVPALKLDSVSILALIGNGEALLENGVWKGSLSSDAEIYGMPWTLSCNFAKNPDGPLEIPSYKIEAPTTEITGELLLDPKSYLLTGTSNVSIGQLQELKIPNTFGTLEATLLWNERDSAQTLSVQGTGSLFYWKDFFAENLSFEGNVFNPFSAPTGTLSFDLARGSWKTLQIESSHFETSNFGNKAPFLLTLQGEWTHPLSLEASGVWSVEDKILFLQIGDVSGTFFNHPFRTLQETSCRFGPDLFQITPLDLSVRGARLLASVDLQKTESSGSLSLEEFPIDFLSLNPLDVSVTGLLNGTASFQEKKDELQGAFQFQVKEMDVLSLNDPYPIHANGNFQGTLKNNRLDSSGKLNANQKPLLSYDLSLPVRVSLSPFEAKFEPQEKVKGHLIVQGKCEDFLDFFDLGTHVITGDCTCDLSLQNTLALPRIEGICTLRNGTYQNYYTGTDLREINFSLVSHKNRMTLESFTAKDASTGTLIAKGELLLNLAEKFPFHIDADFSNLTSVQLNLVQAKTTGHIRIHGDMKGMKASGNIEVSESTLTIPQGVPRKLPELEVVYRNPSKPTPPPTPKPSTPFPFALDLSVSAPNTVSVAGRGLDSTWGGSFFLGGTYDELRAKGRIALTQGSFTFSGKHFDLTEGSLTLSGEKNEVPYLDITGSTLAKGITVLINLKGPLNNPQVSLHSSPPLSLSSILSLLLFGQEISDINSFQALQLVNSLTSLAGESSSVLEQSRRALGIDRVQIVTVPAGDEEGETIAIQVGKYVAEGIIVTFSQGAEDSGANIGVEVELSNGFSFQIESQQQQEQGKFSLKWSKNY